MRLVRLILTLGIMVASLACAAKAAPADVASARPSTNSQLVGVTLGEFTVRTDATAVPAGRITFAVRNNGSAKHELVVLQSAATNLSVDPQSGKAAEDSDGVKHVGEIDGLDAGRTMALTLDLPPGTYLLICNIPGHYHLGMVAKLIVN